jgi:hypothetical protein
MNETLTLVLTGLGIIVSILYYSNVLRNANKTQENLLETRKTQLLVDIIKTVNDPEFKLRQDRVFYIYDWDDYDDFEKNYGVNGDLRGRAEIDSIHGFYHSVAVLLATGRIDSEQLGMHLGYQPIQLWRKFESIILEDRRRIDAPYRFAYLEFLKDEMEKIETYPKGKASYLAR